MPRLICVHLQVIGSRGDSIFAAATLEEQASLSLSSTQRHLDELTGYADRLLENAGLLDTVRESSGSPHLKAGSRSKICGLDWEGRWTYNTDYHGDLLPFCILQMNSTDKAAALSLLLPGPNFGVAPLPTFDYDLDTLALHYGRCGKSVSEDAAYKQHIDIAVSKLAQYTMASPDHPVKRTEVTYCPTMVDSTYRDVINFCCSFSIVGLEKLSLTVHHHHPEHSMAEDGGAYVDVEQRLRCDAEKLKNRNFPMKIVFTDLEA